MIGVTMMDATAFVSAYRSKEHQLSRAAEHRRQAEQNGSVVHRHHGLKKHQTQRAKTI